MIATTNKVRYITECQRRCSCYHLYVRSGAQIRVLAVHGMTHGSCGIPTGVVFNCYHVKQEFDYNALNTAGQATLGLVAYPSFVSTRKGLSEMIAAMPLC